jgi:hypothetical protein
MVVAKLACICEADEPTMMRWRRYPRSWAAVRGVRCGFGSSVLKPVCRVSGCGGRPKHFHQQAGDCGDALT